MCCNCGDLKYAKKNHNHPYETQTAHDNDVAALQAQIDAQATAHTDDVAALQAQIDQLIQDLIDCGCITPPVECQDFANEFNGSLGDVFLDQDTDWTLDLSGGNDELRVRRNNGATEQYCGIYVVAPNDGAYDYVTGMTLEFDLDNDLYIEQTEVFIEYAAGGQIPSSQSVHTSIGLGGDIQSGIDLSFLADGDVITHVFFNVKAEDFSTALARFLLNYVRIVCP